MPSYVRSNQEAEIDTREQLHAYVFNDLKQQEADLTLHRNQFDVRDPLALSPGSSVSAGASERKTINEERLHVIANSTVEHYEREYPNRGYGDMATHYRQDSFVATATEAYRQQAFDGFTQNDGGYSIK